MFIQDQAIADPIHDHHRDVKPRTIGPGRNLKPTIALLPWLYLDIPDAERVRHYTPSSVSQLRTSMINTIDGINRHYFTASIGADSTQPRA